MSGFNANNVPGNGGARKAFPPMEPGTYPARLVGLYTLGVQPQRPFKGEEKPPVLELMTTYECLDEFLPDDDGEPDETKPRWLSETLPFYNISQDKAKSTKRYFALDPDNAAEGDWSKLIGSPINITIVVEEGSGKNAGRFYENISGTSAMRAKDAAKAPDLVNAPRIFDFYNPDKEVYDALPEWLRTKMQGAVDYPGSALEALVNGKEAPKHNEPPKAEKPAQEPENGSEEDW